MQDHVVSDRAILSDGQWKAHVGMAGCVILHIGVFADLDPLVVAAQHRAEPNAGAIEQANPADHRGSVGDEVVSVCREFGRLPVQFVDRHRSSVSCSRRLWHSRFVQASTPAARSVIRKNVPDIMLQNPASTVAIMTNSKRRRSIRAPSSVLRMMMKGAAKTRNGTAANVFGATPSCSSPKPAGRCTNA